MFKPLLLASAFSLSVIVSAQAAVATGESDVLATTQAAHQLQLADRNGGGENSGSGNSGSGSSNSGHNESNSGHHDNDDDDDVDDNDDDNDESGSGRSKPRIPGGSGCDDPGDVAEHSECAG